MAIDPMSAAGQITLSRGGRGSSSAAPIHMSRNVITMVPMNSPSRWIPALSGMTCDATVTAPIAMSPIISTINMANVRIHFDMPVTRSLNGTPAT